MAKPKIVIASSERTSVVAEKLRDELFENCDPDTWEEVRSRRPTQSRIEMLEQSIKEYDFAVIILSEGDVLAQNLGQHLKTRDDCVFKAGFFMAAVGRPRCFLLTSVQHADLPSDLEGLLSVNFTDPDDFEDREKCAQAIRSASGYIKDLVQKRQREELRSGVATRPLTIEELLEREKRQSEGGELWEDQVVVASGQPFGLDYKTVKQIRRNIENNISYKCFFPGDTITAVKIPQLLHMILFTNYQKSVETVDYQLRDGYMKDNRAQILLDLKDICLKDQLNVFFLPESLDLPYCIHNATSDKVAKLYVKHDDEFIEWYTGQEAYRFWCDVREKMELIMRFPSTRYSMVRAVSK